MKTVILGAGSRGFALAKHLIDDGKNVVVIDLIPERVKFVSSRLDCLAICGSGVDVDILKSADLDASDAFVAVTENDEVNIVSCSIVSNVFGVKRTIAAIRNIGYTGNVGAEGKTLLGITHLINPEQEAAKRISNMIMHGVYTDVIAFQNSSFILYNVSIPKDSEYAGKTLIELRQKISISFVVVAVYRFGKAQIPAGDTVIMEGDVISVVVESTKVNALLRIFDQGIRKAKKIVIVGATPIARYLLSFFDESILKNVVLIDEDEKKSEMFAKAHPDILVLNNDLTEENVFLNENLTGYDLMISLEDSDEFNILIACVAKRFGFKHAVALIKSKSSYLKLAQPLDVDAIISVTEETVSTLLKFLRDDNISSVQSLFGRQVEILEYVISPDSKLVGKRLMDINMKNRGIIAGISKPDGQEIIPSGGYTIEPGDTLLTAVGSRNIRFITSLMG